MVRDIYGLVFVDTSAWILALKGEHKEAVRLIDHLLAENRVATSGIVVLELSYGIKTKKDFKELVDEMESLKWLEMDAKVWRKAYSLAYQSRRKGITVPAVDVLIAALVIENNCKLVHADNHFNKLSEVGFIPEKIHSYLEPTER